MHALFGNASIFTCDIANNIFKEVLLWRHSHGGIGTRVPATYTGSMRPAESGHLCKSALLKTSYNPLTEPDGREYQVY